MDSSRRKFIKQNALLGLGMFLPTKSMDDYGVTQKKDSIEKKKNVGKIGGRSLKQWREKYRTELFDRFLPSMDKYAIDHEYGGVFLELDVRTGELLLTNKRTWFVGRILWVYSFLYNNFRQDSKYLEIARKSKNLLLKLKPQGDNFWVDTFTRKGKPLTGPGDIYGSLFVAEGLQEYAVASENTHYRKLAKQIIFNCVDRYDQPDYRYNIGYLPDAPPIKGPRVNGHWMIFLSLATQMLKHEHDRDIKSLADRCVNAILEHHLNPDYGLINEIINHDFSLPNNKYSQFSVIGHGLETLMFVMKEAVRRKDTDLFKTARDGFKRHVTIAKDDVYGGYFHGLPNIYQYKWDISKSLWNQHEVLNGSLLLIEHAGDPWAKKTFAETSDYIYKRFFKPDNKFWFSGGNRKMANPRGDHMEPYHHAREKMFTLLGIERIMERGGKISDLL